jgi:hypothetical protein
MIEVKSTFKNVVKNEKIDAENKYIDVKSDFDFPSLGGGPLIGTAKRNHNTVAEKPVPEVIEEPVK